MARKSAPTAKAKAVNHVIREWRKYRKLTQEQLAEAIGQTSGAISQLENGLINYTQPTLEAIASALGTSPAHLLGQDPALGSPPVEVALRSALSAYGVHDEDMSRILKVIDGFVDDVDDAERELSDRAQPEPANHRREPAPKGKRVPQSSS